MSDLNNFVSAHTNDNEVMEKNKTNAIIDDLNLMKCFNKKKDGAIRKETKVILLKTPKLTTTPNIATNQFDLVGFFNLDCSLNTCRTDNATNNNCVSMLFENVCV